MIDYALTQPVRYMFGKHRIHLFFIILNYRLSGKIPYFDQQNQILPNDSSSYVRKACFFFNLYLLLCCLFLFFSFPFSGDSRLVVAVVIYI